MTDLYRAAAGIGDAFVDGMKTLRTERAAQEIGAKIEAGDFDGAAKTALTIGDLTSGLKLAQLAQDRKEQAHWTDFGNKYAGVGDAQSAAPKPRAENPSGLPTFASAGGDMGSYLATVRGKESGGNDLAQNPNSTANGRYQFTTGTWAGLMKSDPDLGLTANGRSDPAQQERAMARFTAKNAEVLSAAGVPVNPGNLYTAHFLGAQGATRFLGGLANDPDGLAVRYVGRDAANANRSVFLDKAGQPKTTRQVYAQLAGGFGSGATRTTEAAPAGREARAVTPIVAMNEDEVAAAERATGMVPDAPIQVAAAPEPGVDPRADLPVEGAQSAQFFVPPGKSGQGAEPALPPAIEPGAQLPAFVKPAGNAQVRQLIGNMLRDKSTRAAGLQAMVNLQTKGAASAPFEHRGGLFQYDSSGELKQIIAPKDRFGEERDDQGNVWSVNKTTGERKVSLQSKPETTNVAPGNAVVDQRTGRVIYKADDRDKTTEGEAKLRAEFTKQLGTFTDVQDGYRRLIAATEQREASPESVSPASDIALIFGYMKMLDPGSVVREGEYATAKNAAGIPERVQNLYNKAVKGEFLTPNQRQDFVDTAGRLYGQARQSAELTAARYRGLAAGQSLDEGRVVNLPDALVAPKVSAAKRQAGGDKAATDDAGKPIAIPRTMSPDDVRKAYKSGTRIVLPDGTEGVVP